MEMPQEAAQTARFVQFMDKLFDSVNGRSPFERTGKPLRAAVTDTSPHVPFWNEALPILQSIVYVDPRTKATSVPPTVKNWVHTIHAFQELFKLMRQLGFKYFAPRMFNQDPVENCFGRIRQKGGRYVNPTAEAFTPFYKSLLVTTITSARSYGGNCEDDRSSMFVTLQRFVTQVIHCHHFSLYLYYNVR